MQRNKLYVVNDRVAETSGPIFEARNHGVATRKYKHMLNEEKALNVDDYQLLCIGEFDHDVNLITKEDFPKIIVDGENVMYLDEVEEDDEE